MTHGIVQIVIHTTVRLVGVSKDLTRLERKVKMACRTRKPILRYVALARLVSEAVLIIRKGAGKV